MTSNGQAKDTASAFVAASTELLEGLNAAESPLSIVSRSLAGLADTLGVEQALVAIDDSEYGRQVFCSGRRLLGDNGDMLFGPPRLRTEPPSAINEPLARLVVAAVTTTFERARASSAPASRRAVARPEDLITKLGGAAERCSRYGWGFTFVLVRLDDADEHTPRLVGAHLRASDTIIEVSPRDLAIVLPAASAEQVPGILARVGRSGTVSTFCYGLAACPGDSVDPSSLLVLATARLRDAESTRRAPEVHALEQPLV